MELSFFGRNLPFLLGFHRFETVKVPFGMELEQLFEGFDVFFLGFICLKTCFFDFIFLKTCFLDSCNPVCTRTRCPTGAIF